MRPHERGRHRQRCRLDFRSIAFHRNGDEHRLKMRDTPR
ncbi:hypothetical protein I549_3427 [Mycobacterium avium subsp. avium 2285 (R)]|nr:hypothetical protein I549_3427 [Mycobacterium avium subsp. avium 2285 (R)]